LFRYLLFVAGIAALLNVARGDETTGAETKNSTNLPTIAGGGQATAFRDLAPDKGFLIGLELGLVKDENEEFIKAVRPIYRVGDKEQFGKQFGTHPSHPTIIKAKKGYVVGAITYRLGLNFDGCSLLFMKFENGKLDPIDCYESEWVGYVGKKIPCTIGGDGMPVVGIAGRGSEKEVNGLGLVFQGQEGFNLDSLNLKKDSISKDLRILGAAANPEFKDMTPEGGLLVGFEIGFGKFNKIEMIRSVRPIYRVGSKEVLGEQHGTQLNNLVTLKAKAGYAVGGIAVRHGLGFDGMSLTFMKILDGKLDPKDSYESEYVGTTENKVPTKLGGSGTPVIGIIGKSNDRDMTGMGLLFKGQEGYEPKKK